jgi:hypothetical protein
MDGRVIATLGTVEALQYFFLGLGKGVGNLVTRGRIVGPASQPEVRAAVNLICLRHPLLRTQPQQRGKHVDLVSLHEPVHPEIIWLTVDDPAEADNAILDLHASLGKRDFRTGVQMVLGWVQSTSDNSHRFALCVAHTVSDARSVLRLATELVGCIDTALKFKEAGKDPSSMSLEDAGLSPLPLPLLLTDRLPPRISGFFGIFKALAAGIRFGLKVNKVNKLGFLFPNEAASQEPLPQESCRSIFRHRSLNKDEFQKLQSLCESHVTTIDAIVSAAVACAFAECLVARNLVPADRIQKVGLAATVDLRARHDVPAGELELAYLAGAVFSSLDVDFASLLRSSEAMWGLAKDFKQDVEQQLETNLPWKTVRMLNTFAPATLAQTIYPSLVSGAGPALMNAGLALPPSALQHLQLHDLWCTIVLAANTTICITIYDGTMHLVFNGAEPRISAQTLDQLSDKVILQLHRIISE